MEDNNYSDIEKQRLKRHDYTINRMGYLIVALAIFSTDLLGQGEEVINLTLLALSFFMIILVILINATVVPVQMLKNRILGKTVAYIIFITVSIWITGKQSTPLYYLYYLVIIGASLTLSRRLLVFEILLITICFLFLNYTLSDNILLTIKSLIYQLFPFWVLAYFASEIFKQTEEAKNKLEHLSLTDNLTGMWNMRNFLMILEGELNRSARYSHDFSIMMLDSDNLKSVNDNYGHLEGSKLIQKTAQIMMSNLRKSDTCARYGGDEFIVLFPETAKEQAARVAERIRQEIESKAIDVKGEKVQVTASIGLASYPKDGQTADELIAKADHAMYYGKKSGKNRVSCFSPEMNVIVDFRAENTF